MTNEQIVQLEHNRVNNLNMIYLIRDNNNWYRAYEWSAYLLEFYPKSLSDKPLKATKKHFNGINQDLVWVSLQPQSFDKYMPEAQYNKEASDDLIPVIIDLSLYNEINLLNYSEVLNKWKENIEIKPSESKQKSSSYNQNEKKVYKSSEIEQKILGFQYYNLEKEDLIKFI